MERADQALYVRKGRLGRHGVTVAEPSADVYVELKTEDAQDSSVPLR